MKARDRRWRLPQSYAAAGHGMTYYWSLPHQSGNHRQNTPFQLTVSIDGVETLFQCPNPSSLFGDGHDALHACMQVHTSPSQPTNTMNQCWRLICHPNVREHQLAPSPPYSSILSHHHCRHVRGMIILYRGGGFQIGMFQMSELCVSQIRQFNSSTGMGLDISPFFNELH